MYTKELSIMFRISVVENIMAHYKMGKYNKNKSKKEKKDIDLFKPNIKEEEYHPHFKYLLREENYKIREVLKEWSIGFKDRDNKFVKEFQKTFNSSFWELLYKCFRKLNYKIDFTKSSPDFITYTSYSTLCIEATTANEAEKDEPEWAVKNFKNQKKKSFEEFINYASFRIFNAITSKVKNFNSSYSNLSHVKKKPFIIAVAPFEQAMFSNQNNIAINRVLYAKDIDIQKMCEIDVLYTKKNDGTKLKLGIFRSNEYSEVSAIIFSSMATISKVITQTDLECEVHVTKYKVINSIEEMKEQHSVIKNKDYNEEILDGLQIHHNPYAKIPLDLREFNDYFISHYFYDIENENIILNQNDGTLVSRKTTFFNYL